MPEHEPTAVVGTADPVELRHLAEAWPEDIWPTPPEEKRAKGAAAAHVLRRMAVPHFLACADEIERLRAALRDAGNEVDAHLATWGDRMERDEYLHLSAVRRYSPVFAP